MGVPDQWGDTSLEGGADDGPLNVDGGRLAGFIWPSRVW